MEEPSLLDYLKAKLSLKALLKSRPTSDAIPGVGTGEEVVQVIDETDEIPHRVGLLAGFPWRTILAVGLGMIAQRTFEPDSSQWITGTVFYIAAFCMLIYALLKQEWLTARFHAAVETAEESRIHKTPLYALLPLVLLCYFAFSNNQFTAFNILLWIVTFTAALAAFWQPRSRDIRAADREKLSAFLKRPEFRIRFSYWWLLVVAVFCLAAYFHLSQLDSVPLEMTSDHAEKLLDIQDVLNGSSPIFFTRNAGREPIQFYLSAFLINVFGMDLGFTTLKLGMALAFLLSLIYVYLLGKEVGNRWTGLFAVLLLGIAAWTNILARVGMRLVLTPVFTAPVLFYLLRGLRTQRRNDFILSGILLGVGLMGYSAFRIVPFVVVVCAFIYLAHIKDRTSSVRLFKEFSILVIFAVVAALPLLRFAMQYPDLIGMRTITRMTSVEQAIEGPVYIVFLKNLWNAVVMPFWRDGNTWVIAVTGRPALDLVSAAMYLLGTVLLVYSWLKHRDWQYLFLLISIPIFMLPSILALAFPIENPSLSRAGGAVVPIILICAIALERLLTSLWKQTRNWGGRFAVVLAALALIGASVQQNYSLVFEQYNTQYVNATWNTSQMGEIARDYIDSIGSPDTVYVVAKAYWVDTRLVAMNAGYINGDYQIWPEDLETTLPDTRCKLFFVKDDDEAGMAALRGLYPTGMSELHKAEAIGRDFYTYFVPPQTIGE